MFVKMNHSELGGSFNNFHFKFVEPHEHDRVVKILEEYLYPSMEPLGYKSEGAEDFNAFFLAMMNRGHNLSYIAVDSETGEIAAARMVDLVQKDSPSEFPPFKHKSNIDSFAFCAELCKNEDLFGKYDITEYPDMFGLCTVAKYRQRGLATEMYTRGLNCFKKRGYKIVKCGFVSPFTRKAGMKHGYKEFARSKFLDCRNPEGEIMNPNAYPEGFICFGIFDLRDRQNQ